MSAQVPTARGSLWTTPAGTSPALTRKLAKLAKAWDALPEAEKRRLIVASAKRAEKRAAAFRPRRINPLTLLKVLD